MIGQIALLELVRKYLEADQKEEEIGECDPFVLDVASQRRGSMTCREAAHQGFVSKDYGQADQCDRARMLVEDRDAEQHQTEQIIFHWCAEQSGAGITRFRSAGHDQDS